MKEVKDGVPSSGFPFCIASSAELGPDRGSSLVGRLKRFTKLFGRRVSLEDVERELESTFPVRAMAIDAGERLGVHVAMDGSVSDTDLVAHLARFLAVPPSAITIRRVMQLPLTATGKKDYKAVEAI